jgi:hypothetical protein
MDGKSPDADEVASSSASAIAAGVKRIKQTSTFNMNGPQLTVASGRSGLLSLQQILTTLDFNLDLIPQLTNDTSIHGFTSLLKALKLLSCACDEIIN